MLRYYIHLQSPFHEGLENFLEKCAKVRVPFKSVTENRGPQWPLLLVLTYGEAHIWYSPCYSEEKLSSLFHFNNPNINTYLPCLIFFPLTNLLSKDIFTLWLNLLILPVFLLLVAFLSKDLENMRKKLTEDSSKYLCSQACCSCL